MVKKDKGKIKISKDPARPENNIPTQDMGIGLLGRPDLLFVRKFRWTLEGTSLPESFAINVKIDYFNKTLTFSYYDVVLGNQGMHALKWASKVANRENPKEELVFKTFDGLGRVLYQVVFSDLRIVGHTSDFDYSSSEAATQNIIVNFRQADAKLFCNLADFQSQPAISDHKFKNPASIKRKRKTTEINHLNVKAWIPPI